MIDIKKSFLTYITISMGQIELFNHSRDLEPFNCAQTDNFE